MVSGWTFQPLVEQPRKGVTVMKTLKKKAKLKDKGGRPRLAEGQRSVVVGVSLSEAEAEAFLADAGKFADGNKSEFFRRIYRYWQHQKDVLVGEAI